MKILKIKFCNRYNGSLTLPPCTQNVDWFVRQEPVKISKESLDKLDTATKLNRYTIKNNFKKTLDTLETIDEEDANLANKPIDNITESEINNSSNGWCSIS